MLHNVLVSEASARGLMAGQPPRRLVTDPANLLAVWC
jgi:hypothetical protein